MTKPEPGRHALPPLLIAIVLLGAIVLAVFVLLPVILIGPGLSPNQDFAETLISNQSMFFGSCSGNSIGGNIHSAFCVEQQSSGSFPFFPTLAQTSGYVVFRNTSSGKNYTVAIWYFNNLEDFTVAQDRLLAYLKRHGSSIPVTLDLRREQEQVRIYNRENPGQEMKLVPESLQATAFIGNTTSGYFFVSHRQFATGRDDSLIEYFGMLDNNSLQEGAADLEQLVAFNDDSWNLFHGSAALS